MPPPYLCCIKNASDVHGSNVLKVDCPDYRHVCVLLMYTPDRATTAKSGMENDYNGATQRGAPKASSMFDTTRDLSCSRDALDRALVRVELYELASIYIYIYIYIHITSAGSRLDRNHSNHVVTEREEGET